MRGKLLGGRYRIQNKLGEGGMANVYVALDEKLQRRVAIKILHRHMASNADIRQRFYHEAQAISALEHPNILKIYDFSGEGSEDIWIVTEILKGQNLNEYVTSFPGRWLHPIIAAIIVREILKALEKAHAEGLVHRDIKPENIMVLDEGKIKLMDFGIAKNIKGNSITQTGTFMGSPSYMSPEQIRGKAVDQRSDLYSLGVLFYEIVTGKLPYTGTSTHDVIMKICEGIYKEPGAIVPNLPPDMNKIIVKAMAKYPSSRYQEARSFSRDLDIFLLKNNFEESNIELERYFKDREKFDERLRQLDFTNRPGTGNKTTAYINENAELHRQRTRTQQETRHLNNDTQVPTTLTPQLLQQRNAAAIEQPKSPAQITWIEQATTRPVASQHRRDHKVPAHFVPAAPVIRHQQSNRASGQNLPAPPPRMAPRVQPQAPGRLKKRRSKPRTPKRHHHTQVVYRVTTYAPRRGSGAGLVAGIILVAAILGASMLGYNRLQELNSSEPIRSITTSSKAEEKPEARHRTPPNTPTVAPKPEKNLAIPAPQQQKEKPSNRAVASPANQTATRPQQIVAPPPATAATKTESSSVAPQPGPAIIATPAPSVKMPPEEQPAVTNLPSLMKVSSQPASEIFVNGSKVGTTVDRTSSSQWIKLEPGQTVLELRRTGYRTHRRIINVDGKGARMDLGNIQLGKNSEYVLTISSNKPAVRVTMMNLSDQYQRSFVIGSGAQSQTLNAGRYRIRFYHQGQMIERNLLLSGSEVQRNMTVHFD